MADLPVIPEAMPREVSAEEISAIESLFETDEELQSAAHVFTVDWNQCRTGMANYGILNWMPLVHHHWIAVTGNYVRVGQFARFPVDFAQYRKNRAIRNWHSILKHRASYLAFPTVCSAEISGHTAFDPGHLSQVAIDSDGTDAYIFSDGNFWEWRWVLDANGMQSSGNCSIDGSWGSATSPLYLNRLQYVCDGHRVELFSFHDSICQVADGIKGLLGGRESGGQTKPKRSKKSNSRVEHKNPEKIDVEGLAKLAALHKSGALTDDEFAQAKKSLLS